MKNSNRDVLLLVKDFLKTPAIYNEKAVHCAIFFADLVGSTEFKRDHTIPEGLAKTVQHNQIATEAIMRFHGRVVKYIGDEVMGIFEGNECERSALKAGLAHIERISESNSEHNWPFPLKMTTKVGVHSGPVWMFKFEESTVEDPQGTTVDVAARLCSMAGHDQVLCTAETYKRAGDVLEFPNASGDIKRYIRGIKDPHSLRVLAPDGKSCEPLSLEGKPSPLENDFWAAHQLILEKKLPEAVSAFQKITKTDPGHFHANLCAADLLIQDANGRHDSDGESERNARNEKLDLAFKHLCNAKWARPHLSRVWLLFSWLRYKWYESETQPEKQEKLLDEAIDYAKSALERAQDGLNIGGILQAKVSLANYLFASATRKGANQREDKLSMANELCAEVSLLIETALDTCRADYYVVHALVRLASGDKDYEDIGGMIRKAKQLTPENIRVYRAELEWAKRAYKGREVAAPGNLSELAYSTAQSRAVSRGDVR